MATPPPMQETKEFQFKLHSRLRIFHNPSAVNSFPKNVGILSASSRYGLLFAGHPSGFRVISISSVQVSKSVEQKEYEHCNIDLPSQPVFLAVNADQTLLAVVIETDSGSLAVVYDVQSLTTQQAAVKYQLRLTQDPSVIVQDLQWNPAIPNLISFNFSDGSFLLNELKDGGNFGFNSLPIETLATCHSWSPKGKQIVIGSANGTLNQHKPDLKLVKTVPAPTCIQNPSVVNIHWISSFQFCVVYRNATNPEERPYIVIVNTPKNEPIQYINYEDICFSMGTLRPPQYYIIHQQSWNVLLVSSANSGEVGVLSNDAKNWVQLSLIDEGRAELPADPVTKDETYPVGFALDVSSVQPIPWGTENQVIPPMPILAILSHCGVLCLFHVVNFKEPFVPICAPPDPLLDKSALRFTAALSQESCEPANVPQHPPAQAPPEQQTTPVNQSLNFSVAAASPPQQNEPPSFPTFPKSDGATKKLDFSFAVKNSVPVSGEVQSPEISVVDTTPAKIPAAAASPFGSISTGHGPEKAVAKAAKSAANSAMYVSAVFDEIAQCEAEMKDFKNSAKALNVVVGTEEEKNKLKRNFDSLENFYKELTETTSSLNLEVDSLKTILMEAFSWIEDAKARKLQLHHSGYQKVVRLQELDPISLRRLNSIQSSVYYVESQLQQANTQLDSLWADSQEPFAKNQRNMKMPMLENIYQAMIVQKNIFNKLHSTIDRLSSEVKSFHNEKPFVLISNTSASTNGDSELSKLAENLIKVKLSETGTQGSASLEARKHLVSLAKKQILSVIKEVKLKELQSIHTPKRIKAARLKMTNGTLFGSCNVLPLPTSSDTISSFENSSPASQPISSVQPGGFSGSTPSPSFKQTPVDSFSVVTSQPPVIHSSPQNGFSFSSAVAQQKDKAFSSPGASFNFGKSDTVPGFAPTTVSVAPQISFKTVVASSAPVLPTSPLAMKPVASSPAASVATTGVLDKSAVKFSFASIGDNENKEAENLAKPALTSTKNMSFGKDVPKTNVAPFSFAQLSKPEESAVAGGKPLNKTNVAPFTFAQFSKPDESATAGGKPPPTELSFGSLSFGVSSTTASPTSKPASPSIFGGSASAGTFNLFGGKPTTTVFQKSGEAPTSVAITSSPPNAESVKTSVVTSPASDSSPSQVNNSSTEVVSSDVSKTGGSSIKWSSPATSVGSYPLIVPSFSFGNEKKAEASTSSSPPEIPKSVAASSSESAVPVSSSTTAVSANISQASLSTPSTFSFSLASSGNETSVSNAPVVSPFSAVNLTSTAPASSAAPVFSFSSVQTFVTSTPAVATSETKPAFSFGQALGTSGAQSPFTTFSFGNVKSQPSIFGDQAKTEKTPPSTTVVSTASDSSPVATSVSSPAPTAATPATTTAADAANSLFESLAVSPTSKASIFGGTPTATSTSTNIFGSAVTTTAAAPTIFGNSPTTATGPSLFGTPTTTATATPSFFGATPTTMGTSVFGQAAVVSTAPQTSNLFASAVQVTTGVRSPSIFGGPVTSVASTSAFGLATTSASVAKPSLFADGSTSVFGSPASNTATTTAANVSVFGSPATPATASNSSFFGQAICSPNPTTGNVFSQSPSVFGQATTTGASPFGSPPLFGGKPTFGQSGGSLFGNSSNSFGQSSGTSVFGSPTGASVLGGNTTAAPVFGQSPGANLSGGIFGGTSTSGSAFSGGLNQSVAQAGFGTPPSFQNKPAGGFGSPPTFGSSSLFSSTSAPAFGAAPAFGSPPSMFGSTSPGNAFDNRGMSNLSAPTNTTFENLAKQNTVSFGNLAQNQAPTGFGNTGSIFGGSPQATDAFPKQAPQQFGGSSFSSWR